MLKKLPGVSRLSTFYAFVLFLVSWVLSLFVLFCFLPLSGHDGCVEILLEHDHFKKFSGNRFSPLHCAV